MTPVTKRPRYSVAGREFMTKAALKDETRKIIVEHLDERVPAHHSDAVFLLTVLQHHLRFEEKAADGVAALHCYDGNTSGLHAYSSRDMIFPALDLEHMDGSRIDISWVKAVGAISAVGRSISRTAMATDAALHHRDQLLTAMRAAVVPQVLQFRWDHHTAHGQYVSAMSGPVEEGARVHVDHHDPTFLQLAQTWVDEQGGFGQVELTGLDRHGAPGFARDEDLHSWYQYHQDHAVLRILTEKENLGRGARTEDLDRNDYRKSDV